MFAYTGVVKSMVWLGKGGMGMAIVGGGSIWLKRRACLVQDCKCHHLVSEEVTQQETHEDIFKL